MEAVAVADEATLVSQISALEREAGQLLGQRLVQVETAAELERSLNAYLAALAVCDASAETLRAAPVVSLAAWREVCTNGRRVRAMVVDARIAASGAANALKATVTRLSAVQSQLVERRRLLAELRSATARIYEFRRLARPPEAAH